MNIQEIVVKNIQDLTLNYPKEQRDVLTQILTPKAKMIRPSLVLVGAGILDPLAFLDSSVSLDEKMKDKEPLGKDIINAMSAIELTHISSLYHDDIIDNDNFRRGVESVNNKFGIEKALIGGDIVFSMSLKCLKNLEPSSYEIILTAFDKMCVGQMLELTKEIETREDYFEIIRLKTSALIEASVELGILISKTLDSPIWGEKAKKLREFSKNYGVWFQLNDDFEDNDPSLEKAQIKREEKDEWFEKTKNSLV